MEETKTINIAVSAIALEPEEYNELIKARTQLGLIKIWAEQANPLYVPDAVRIILGMGATASEPTLGTEEPK